MKNNWLTSGNIYLPREVSQQIDALPVAVYRMAENPMTKEIYLIQTQSRFEFDYKVYGIEQSLINRVTKTYAHTGGNLGVLLNGTKGTGKTVTGRLICNALNLPVLIVPESFQQIPSFVNEIQQDVLIFIDEYEKVYKDYDDRGLLTVMDGILNSNFRRVFLLTTNRLHVNDNLLQRPGRIRYVKTFGDLSVQSIIEIVDDMLTVPSLRSETIEFIANLETITVDIVKSVVEEVNIHRESPAIFGEVFNTKANGDKFNVYEVGQGMEPKLAFSEVQCRPAKITREHIRWDFYAGAEEVGEIVATHQDDSFTVEMLQQAEDEPKVFKTFKMEPLKSLHRNFWHYAF